MSFDNNVVFITTPELASRSNKSPLACIHPSLSPGPNILEKEPIDNTFGDSLLSSALKGGGTDCLGHVSSTIIDSLRWIIGQKLVHFVSCD
jgi:hypothetical protein